ncbi:DJ-1/PfpI family protein [Cytobacillus praedii]|uniref:DJ-1/PfpI family protein n=1 Tax=Cytobacillus praedii TaxID=1742358 RepID=UPI002E1DB8BC|nr:DJ-1/PfpI family protein [Cytobacillus praedii]
MPKQYNVGILLFDYVDALDFTGPYEVFNMTTYRKEDVKKLLTNDLEEKPFNVQTVSVDGKKIKVHHGLTVIPDFSFSNCPKFDIIIVPGGPLKAINNVTKNKEIIDWIASYQNQLIASVCTGALFLAKAGLLLEKKATTNKAALELLAKGYPDIKVISDVKFVDEGNIITSAGVSSGINMALYIVSKLFDKEIAIRTSNTIEFQDNFT